MFSSNSERDTTTFGSLAKKLTPAKVSQNGTKVVFQTQKFSKIPIASFPDEESEPITSIINSNANVCTAIVGDCGCGNCSDDTTGLSWG